MSSILLVSTASEASSSLCSNGINEETSNIWSDLNDAQNAHLLTTTQNPMSNDNLEHELISDIITNDMVIINGIILNHSNSDLIECSFEKSQIADSFFIEHQSDPQLQRHQIHSSASAIGTAILNDSSNEVYICIRFTFHS